MFSSILSTVRRKMGLQSLPVAFGVDTAKWICVSTIDVTQLGVAAYLAFGLKEYTYAGVLLALILPQVRAGWGLFMDTLLVHESFHAHRI